MKNFRADIEGLRAVAVLSILVFHIWPLHLRGGFVGVDIFFVISGYLISKNIIFGIQRGNFSILEFYKHRARRILPAFFVLIGCCLAVAPLFLAPNELKSFAASAAASTAFLANIFFLLTSGYFDGSSQMKPLLHTWSLAVEEQFYLIFPLILTILFRYSRAAVIVGCALLFFSSYLFSVFVTPIDGNIAFYFPFGRFSEFLLGFWVAFLSDRGRSVKFSSKISSLGAILVFCSILFFDEKMGFPGGWALIPAFGTALMILGGEDKKNIIFKTLSIKPLQLFGRISYSLYLWHWPIIVFLRHYQFSENLSWRLAALALILSIFFAVVSYSIVEAPFRRRETSLKKVLVFSCSSAAIVLICSLFIYKEKGVVWDRGEVAMQLFSYQSSYSSRRRECHISEGAAINYATSCVYGNAGPATIAVWADSHGAEFSESLGDKLAKLGISLRQITYSACPPAVGFTARARPGCLQHNLSTLDALIEDKSIHDVIMLAYYKQYMNDGGSEFKAGLSASVKKLIAAGKAVYVVGPWPTYSYGVPEALGLAGDGFHSFSTFDVSKDHFLFENQGVYDFLQKNLVPLGAKLINAGDVFCGDKNCEVARNGIPLYFDNNHLNLVGAGLVAERYISNK